MAASAIASGAGWSAGQTAVGKIPVVGGVASGVAAGAASTLARGGSLTRNLPSITADAVASTIGNMVVSQKANDSVAKTATAANGSMSALYGVGGNYDDLIRQTAQQSYNVSAGDQFAGMANWDLALQGQVVSAGGAGGAAGYVGGIPSQYGGAGFNVEQVRAQRIADMQLEAANPAIVHAAPVLGELNVLVTGVGSRQAPDGYGEMRAVPLNMRDALNDPSVASTPGGVILGFGYNVVEHVIGDAAALFSGNNLNPVSGEMLSPGQMQRAKEDLVINAGTFAIGGENLLAGAARSSAAGLRTFGESGTGQAFAARLDQLNYRMGLQSYAVEPKLAADAISSVQKNIATADVRKFTDYIFKPGADHGKTSVFSSLGYSAADSAVLAGMWESQGAEKYVQGQFTLGKLDNYGQRINIEIELQGRARAQGQTSYLRSGWMIQEDGSIKLNTPFSGFTRSTK